MKKLIVVFGLIFGTFFLWTISGCGDDYKNCTCYITYSGPGSENYPNETVDDEVLEEKHCDDLNSTYTYDSGLVKTVNCVGNY